MREFLLKKVANLEHQAWSKNNWKLWIPLIQQIQLTFRYIHLFFLKNSEIICFVVQNGVKLFTKSDFCFSRPNNSLNWAVIIKKLMCRQSSTIAEPYELHQILLTKEVNPDENISAIFQHTNSSKTLLLSFKTENIVQYHVYCAKFVGTNEF